MCYIIISMWHFIVVMLVHHRITTARVQLSLEASGYVRSFLVMALTFAAHCPFFLPTATLYHFISCDSSGKYCVQNSKAIFHFTRITMHANSSELM